MMRKQCVARQTPPAENQYNDSHLPTIITVVSTKYPVPCTSTFIKWYFCLKLTCCCYGDGHCRDKMTQRGTQTRVSCLHRRGGFYVYSGEARARRHLPPVRLPALFLCAEESDEDEDEENSEESVEDESEEDLTDTPRTSPTQPPYSLIPPPPVWVQHDQGLSERASTQKLFIKQEVAAVALEPQSFLFFFPVRSWVELIREKVTLPPAAHLHIC